MGTAARLQTGSRLDGWTRARGLALLTCGAIAGWLPLAGCDREEPPPRSQGLIRVLVAPVEASTAGSSATEALQFNRMVATYLNQGTGVHSATDTTASYDYVLEGNLQQNGGRLVLRARLLPGRLASPVWTASFWRAPSGRDALASDVAAAVLEALQEERARSSLPPQRRRP